MNTDAQIFEEMRNKQLDDYYKSQGGNDNHDECFEKIDNESTELTQSLIEMIKKYSDKYKIDSLQILKDMIYPTLHEGVL